MKQNIETQTSKQKSPAPIAVNVEEFHDHLLELTRSSWSTFFLSPKALLLAQQQSEIPLERFLIKEANLTRLEIIQRIIEIKGAYGFFVSNIFVESGLGHIIPEKTALSMQIIPLAVYGTTLYCLTNHDNQTIPKTILCKDNYCQEYTVVSLGVIKNINNTLQDIYTALQKNDASCMRMGEFLIQLEKVTKEQLDICLEIQNRKGGLLGEIMIRKHIISESEFYESLAALLEMPFYASSEIHRLIDHKYAQNIPFSYAKSNKLLALRKKGNTAWIATADPHSLDKINATAASLKAHDVHIGIASPSALLTAMTSIYHKHSNPEDLYLPVEDIEGDEAPEQVEEIQAEIPRFLQYILYEGVQKQASDIHIERYKNRVSIKFRIDGHLSPMPQMTFITPDNIGSLIAKIKVDAQLDIAEQRRPQDGVIRKTIKDEVVDFRVAIVPTLWGENAVLRILSQSATMPKLSELGLPTEKLRAFQQTIKNPQGFILLTGPTGCGKTTTLYAILQELLKTNKKIITAEDPIEYAIEGIQQSQINETIGNTFERYMRSFMRLDPDIILVGEIRDKETADMAAKAAMTGHLVLSTLHVNDSVSTVRRLTDLNVEPNLISQTLLAVISQRLARKSCNQCLHEYKPDPLIIEDYFPKGLPQKINFSHGTGCPACNSTGYNGRTALVEFWQPGAKERGLIDRRTETIELREVAFKNGLKLLAADALEKVAMGLITIEELIRTVPMSQIEYYLDLSTKKD